MSWCPSEPIPQNVSNETVQDCSSKGLILPFLDESNWNKSVRAALYLVGLLWTFMGVAIVADVFMSAIERITSQTKMKRDKEGNKIEVLVWNPTVANLTLMALGSSAPEILLSIIEIVGNGFHSGELGPSTIIGSAAFNLFCITAVCIASPTNGEVKKIAGVYVFAVTTVFGLFAYLWLLFVLKAISRNEVVIWEAVVTFCLFPITVVTAYFADRRICCGFKDEEESLEKPKDPSVKSSQSLRMAGWEKLQYGALEKELALRNPHLSADGIAQLVAAEIQKEKTHSKAYYRRQAGWLASNVRPSSPADGTLADSRADFRSKPSKSDDPEITLIEFGAENFASLESEGYARITIIRKGNLSRSVEFFVETIEGTAKAGEDYVAICQTFRFTSGQREMKIAVKIIDDDDIEPNEVFYMKLDLADAEETNVAIGKLNIAEIEIVSDENKKDKIVQFERNSIIVEETSGKARVPVVRSGGFDEVLAVSWETRDITAEEGKDYLGGASYIMFEPGEVRKYISIPIMDDMEIEKHESFEIRLSKVTEGRSTIGIYDRAIVIIVGDDKVAEWFSKSDALVEKYLDEMDAKKKVTWKDQFQRALNVNDGDVESASFGDYAVHVASFGWKFVFAFIPPPSMLGGWPCFFVALGFIGLLTAVVGDLAAIFGCFVGLKDSVTAITFVALGTSLPDLFASRLAVMQEPTADNAIGNINGSNAVNVFLGLGLPWIIASIYWSVKNQPFCVPAGSLSFSVVLFMIGAVTCIFILVVRRNSEAFGRAELGGPKGTKYASAIFLLIIWICYILFSALQAYGYINGF